MLYGANYFTEEEWIKVDGLIHKGQYVFTQGPPNNILEEPLMTFEDATDDKNDFDLQVKPISSSENEKNEIIIVSELRIPSPTSTEQTPADSPSQTSNEISVKSPSDGEQSVPSQDDSSPMFDFSDTTAQTTTVPAEPNSAPDTSQNKTSGGLALGYTQAQLDEVKAFNAGLTRAGQKGRPKYPPLDETYNSSDWSQNEASRGETTAAEQAYPSPTPTEQDTRIHSWASGINADPISVHSPKVPAPSVASPIPHSTSEAVETFVKVHGRPPKSINDVFQPNNPQHHGHKRPESRASTKTATSTGKTLMAISARGKPKLNVVSGTVLVAQSGSTRNSQIQLDVEPGDKIKYMKHVSGITHTGLNFRTNLTGQFPETIFKRTPGVQSAQNTRSLGRDRVTSVTSTASNGLDSVEGINAAEWDDVSTARPRTVAPAPTRPIGGLATSRFAVLADLDSKSHTSSSDQFEMPPGMSREEVGKMVDEKVGL